MKPTVVLLHGLARTRLSMYGLRRFIEKAGYPTWARSYPSRKLSIQELAELVAGWIRDDLDGQEIVGVTHSLGGILVRHMTDILPWKGLVMLAPPNSGSRIARTLARNPIFKWFYGPAGIEVARPEGWPQPPKPFGIIAGTRGPSMGNPSSWFGILGEDEPHDGTVSVAETRLDDMDDFATIRSSHSGIMNHPETRRMILQFLQSGRF